MLVTNLVLSEDWMAGNLDFETVVTRASKKVLSMVFGSDATKAVAKDDSSVGSWAVSTAYCLADY